MIIKNVKKVKMVVHAVVAQNVQKMLKMLRIMQKTNAVAHIAMKKFIFKLVMVLVNQIAVAVKHHA